MPQESLNQGTKEGLLLLEKKCRIVREAGVMLIGKGDVLRSGPGSGSSDPVTSSRDVFKGDSEQRPSPKRRLDLLKLLGCFTIFHFLS